jgi:hypothetical protein
MEFSLNEMELIICALPRNARLMVGTTTLSRFSGRRLERPIQPLINTFMVDNEGSTLKMGPIGILGRLACLGWEPLPTDLIAMFSKMPKLSTYESSVAQTILLSGGER